MLRNVAGRDPNLLYGAVSGDIYCKINWRVGNRPHIHMAYPNPNGAQPDTGLPADTLNAPDDFDCMEWIMRNIQLNDPIDLRRNELHGWAEAAGFENVDVRNLGDLAGWELRFDRGTNDDCTTAADAERWVGYIARGCGYQFEPGQFVAIVQGEQVAVRFRLQPRA